MPDVPDVLVIGAGMAGCSAMLWARRLGLSARWLEAGDDVGGQLLRTFSPIPDFAGRSAPDGATFVGPIRAQLREAGLAPELGVHVDAVVPSAGGGPAGVRLAGGARATARSVLVATGVAPRSLGLDGEDRLTGVSRSASRDRHRAAGSNVVVCGGGDGAVENAILLAEVGCTVTLVHRGPRLRARRDLIDRLDDATTVLLDSVPAALIADGDRLTGVLADTPSGRSELRAGWVFVKVGFAPVTDLLGGEVELDGSGFVVTDVRQRTSAPGVLAAGDVCSPTLPSLAVAAGQAAIAVRTAAAPTALPARPAR